VVDAFEAFSIFITQLRNSEELFCNTPFNESSSVPDRTQVKTVAASNDAGCKPTNPIDSTSSSSDLVGTAINHIKIEEKEEEEPPLKIRKPGRSTVAAHWGGPRGIKVGEFFNEKSELAGLYQCIEAAAESNSYRLASFPRVDDAMPDYFGSLHRINKLFKPAVKGEVPRQASESELTSMRIARHSIWSTHECECEILDFDEDDVMVFDHSLGASGWLSIDEFRKTSRAQHSASWLTRTTELKARIIDVWSPVTMEPRNTCSSQSKLPPLLSS